MQDYVDPFAEELDDSQHLEIANQQQQPAPVMIPLDQAMAMMQMRQAQPQAAPQQQQVQMTPEQQVAHLRQLQIDEDYATGFASSLIPDAEGKIDGKKAQQAMRSLVEGLRAEYMRTIELNNQNLNGHIEQTLTPVQQFVDRQRAEGAWNGFVTSYPQLANMRQLVDAKAAELAPLMPPGTNQQQAFQYVANAVAQDLKQMGVALPPVSKQRQTQQAPNPFQNNQQFPGLPMQMGPSMSQMPIGLGGRGGAPQGGQRPRNPYYDADTFGK